MYITEWKNLKVSSKTLTDEYIIANCDNLDLDYVFQTNKLDESTLVKLMDLIDLRTLVRTQDFSMSFANEYIVPKLENYSSKTPFKLEEIQSSQKGLEWSFVSIENEKFVIIK